MQVDGSTDWVFANRSSCTPQSRNNVIWCPSVTKLTQGKNDNGNPVVNPYEKPVPLMYTLANRFGADGATLIDALAGSGTTAAAAR